MATRIETGATAAPTVYETPKQDDHKGPQLPSTFYSQLEDTIRKILCEQQQGQQPPTNQRPASSPDDEIRFHEYYAPNFRLHLKALNPTKFFGVSGEDPTQHNG